MLVSGVCGMWWVCAVCVWYGMCVWYVRGMCVYGVYVRVCVCDVLLLGMACVRYLCMIFVCVCMYLYGMCTICVYGVCVCVCMVWYVRGMCVYGVYVRVCVCDVLLLGMACVS